MHTEHTSVKQVKLNMKRIRLFTTFLRNPEHDAKTRQKKRIDVIIHHEI